MPVKLLGLVSIILRTSLTPKSIFNLPFLFYIMHHYYGYVVWIILLGAFSTFLQVFKMQWFFCWFNGFVQLQYLLVKLCLYMWPQFWFCPQETNTWWEWEMYYAAVRVRKIKYLLLSARPYEL